MRKVKVSTKVTTARLWKILCISSVAALSACGGGGGGGVVKPTSFTSWSAVQPNSTVQAQGISQSADYEYSTAGFTGAVTIDSVGPFSGVEDVTVTLSYDGSRNLSAVSVSSLSASVSWSIGSGGTIDCTSNPPLCALSNSAATASGFFANPYDGSLAWNYQTFGVWSYDKGTVSPLTGNFGAMSIGARTPVAALPTTGTAIYNGIASGFYTNGAGDPFSTVANMSAFVNFGGPDVAPPAQFGPALVPQRGVAFITTNTNLTNLNTLTSGSDTNFNLNGRLNYASGSNQFTGTVTNTGASLTGDATGSFYGPAAQEIGGIYSLKNPALGSREAMVGGFGGKQ